MSNFFSAYSSKIQWFKPVFPVFKPVPVAVSASFRFLATVYHPVFQPILSQSKIGVQLWIDMQNTKNYGLEPPPRLFE